MSVTSRIFKSHFPDELAINHILVERGVSCGGNQVLLIKFGVRTQKIRRAYLNGQIVSEFVSVSGCQVSEFQDRIREENIYSCGFGISDP